MTVLFLSTDLHVLIDQGALLGGDTEAALQSLLPPCRVILGVCILRVSRGLRQLGVDLRDSKRQYVVLWLVESIISDLPLSAIYFNACYACFNDFGGTAKCCCCNTDFILFDACICWFEDFLPCNVLHSAIVMYLLKGNVFCYFDLILAILI